MTFNLALTIVTPPHVFLYWMIGEGGGAAGAKFEPKKLLGPRTVAGGSAAYPIRVGARKFFGLLLDSLKGSTFPAAY